MRRQERGSVWLVLGLIWCLLGPGGFAATFYVDFGTGSDGNSGTSMVTAWQHCPGDSNAVTVAKSTVLKAGDIVQFKGGVKYVGEVDIKYSGAAGNPITYDGNSLGSWGTGKAIIDCVTNYYHGIAAPHLLGSRDHIVINNFDIRNIRNVNNATQAVNVVQGSFDVPGTTNTVTFRGDNGTYSYGGVYVYGADWVVSNCDIHDSEQWWYRAFATGDTLNAIPCLQSGIAVYTGTNVLITNCSIWAIGRDCIREQGTNINIVGCNLGGPNSLALTNRGWFGVAIRAAGYLVNSSITHCVIHDGWQLGGDEPKQRCHAGDWIHLYGNSNNILDGNDPVNILIDDCYMYNDVNFSYANGTANVYVEQDVWNLTIRNCKIINPQHMGIWTSGGTVSNITVLNNTIVSYDHSSSAAFLLYIGTTTKQATIANNLLVQFSGNSAAMPLVVLSAVNIGTIYSDYNLFYNPPTAVYGTVRYTNSDRTLPLWRAGTGNDMHSTVANPLFLGLPPTGFTSSVGNYGLAAGSPAIGAGTNIVGVLPLSLNLNIPGVDIGAVPFHTHISAPTNLRIVPPN